MAKKHYSDVVMNKSTDPEGHLEITSYGITTTFLEDGTMVHNDHNDILTWNSGTITHLNFLGRNFSLIFDSENEILTLTDDESGKNLWIHLDDMRDKIKDEGLTIEAMEMLIKAEEKANKNKKENNENE